MKVGIITYFRKNYGAVLQAYALQTILKKIGQSAEIIDYGYPSNYADSQFSSWRSLKGIILNFFAIIHFQQFTIRRQRFAKFQKRSMNVSKRKYFYCDELSVNMSKYDAYICGSDQVWRPRADSDRNRGYFLSFVDKRKAIKIAYAPSFGVSEIPESFQQEIQHWISDIPHLSVREETGSAIIKQATGRHAKIVLDPTLLLEKIEWDRVAKPTTIKKPYILVYSTSQRGLFSELVKHIKVVTGLNVVVLSLYSLNLIPMADSVIYDAGPNEFIGLFANAACVCTNSFHGTAFSIIYRKPFWSVPHNVANSRIADLLSRLKLSDRQLSERSHFPTFPLDIDYSEPEILLDQAIEHSIDFLKKPFNVIEYLNT